MNHATAIDCINQLLFADVIDNTFGVMNRLRSALYEILHKNEEDIDPTLIELLQQLSSESIREALHKSELRITNDIIFVKNQILEKLGIEIPETHKVINPDDYPNYSW